jgi:hypothetical protein
MAEEKQKPKTELTLADMEARPGALMPLDEGGLVPRNFTELTVFAKYVSESGMVPKSYVNNPGAVVVAVQMGAELGLSPMAAIRSICVINGQPSVWGDGLLALIKSDPRCEYVDERTMAEIKVEQAGECTVKRRGNPPVVCEFSVEDAKKAGLWTKAGPWQQYPNRMLQMRARAFACRDAFPDRLSGIAVAEEAQDIDMGPAEFIDPATAVPPEGVRKFGAKPAPEPEPAQEKAQDDNPAAGIPAEEVIAKLKAVPVTAKDGALAQLRQLVTVETRKGVVKAAQERIDAILEHRRNKPQERPETDPAATAPNQDSAAARNADSVAPGPQDMPDWEEEDGEEEPPAPTQAEAEAAGQGKLGGAGF